MRIAPEVTVRLKLNAGAVTGDFVSATPDTIVIRTGGRNVPIQRTSVRAVDQANGKSHRGRNVLIGLAAGAGAGLLRQKATCKGNMCMAEAAFVYTVPLEIVGMVIGAAAPAHNWQTVYRKQK